MVTIRRSALFKRQIIDIATSYRERAGAAIALKFVDQIEQSIAFISKKPGACAIYTRLEGKEFRKWRVDGFPVSVFFRIESDDLIILEALYAHRMDIAARLPKEID